MKRTEHLNFLIDWDWWEYLLVAFVLSVSPKHDSSLLLCQVLVVVGFYCLELLMLSYIIDY